jgi:hypothetical protein
MIGIVREIASYRACNNDLSFEAGHFTKQTLKDCDLVKTAQGRRNLNSWPGFHDCASTRSGNAHLGPPRGREQNMAGKEVVASELEPAAAAVTKTVKSRWLAALSMQ